MILTADAVVIVHFLFVVFVPLGGLLALRWPRAAWAHVPAALWGTLIEFGAVGCPLTPFENALRVAGGENAYDTGFIAHYIMPVLYPAGLTPAKQVVLGVGVVAINAVVYTVVIRGLRRAGKPGRIQKQISKETP